MAAPRSGQRSRFTVVVLLMVCLTLITIDTRANRGGITGAVRDGARDVLAPVQGGLSRVAEPVAGFADGLVNAGDIKAENSRLREENERLRSQNAQLADAEIERRQLLDLNKLDVVQDIPRVTARVTNSAPSNLQLTVEIDRGRDAGVDVGMPVVAGDGLVGRVESATARRAVVRLLTDPGLKVGVRLSGTGTQSVVKGNGPERALSAQLVKPDQAVQRDEVVVTSGLQGGSYPAGIPVGRVVKAEVRAGVAYQDVDVQPVVDIGKLGLVQVLLWRPR